MLIEVNLAYKDGDDPCLFCFDAAEIRAIKDTSGLDTGGNTAIHRCGGQDLQVADLYADVRKKWLVVHYSHRHHPTATESASGQECEQPA